MAVALGAAIWATTAATAELLPTPEDTVDAPTAEELAKAEAAAIAQLRETCRSNAAWGRGSRYNLIGALESARYWRKYLLLAPEQADAIVRLDATVQAMHAVSLRIVAEEPADDAASYRAYVDRSAARRQAAVLHAERMVTLGLLTEQQTAVVYQRSLLTRSKLLPLRNRNFQDLLGMTPAQQSRFAEVHDEFNELHEGLNVMVQRHRRTEDPRLRAAIYANADAAVNRLLTPEQHERWARLTAGPAAPPSTPHLGSFEIGEAEAARGDLVRRSVVLGTLRDEADRLGITNEQQAQLEQFLEVAGKGLSWMGGNRGGPYPAGDARNDPVDPAEQARAEYVRAVEQVVLLALLTERQAERLATANSGAAR